MTLWGVFWGSDLLSIHLTEKGAYEKLEVYLEKHKYSTIFVEELEAEI